MRGKSINALMKYLRDRKHMTISGPVQKKKLRNIGYYHGYKGYRFFEAPTNRLNYHDFGELIAVYDFDMQVKSLIYPQIMFLETAFKNYALEEIVSSTRSDKFADVYSQSLTNYKSFTVGSQDYRKAMKIRLNLRNRIYGDLSRDYGSKLIVKHFYQKDKPVPIWAVFELISFGEFGTLLSCMDKSMKTRISKSIGLNSAFDADGKLTEIIVYALKDLRNAIAHNDAIFDTRFKSSSISGRLSTYLSTETRITNINFSTIVDYILLISYLMKCFGISKTETKSFIRRFRNYYEELRVNVPSNIFTKIIHTDTRSKLQTMMLH